MLYEQEARKPLSEIRISGNGSSRLAAGIISTIASSSHHSPPPHSGFARFIRIRVALGSWAGGRCGCQDAITSGFTSANVHGMPSVHCARIHIRIAPASIHYLPLRPVVCVLVRFRRRRCQLHDPKTCSRRASRRRAWRRWCSRRHVPLALLGRRFLYRFVCCCPCLCVPVGTAPSSSCASLFVSLSLRRSRLGSRVVCNQSPAARVDRVVVSPRSQSHRVVAITTAPGSTTTRAVVAHGDDMWRSRNTPCRMNVE